jgi:hypothetical protein
MRRALIIVVAGALLLALTAGVALAATLTCQPNQPCVGTNDDDQITGTSGVDTIFSLAGRDSVDALGGNVQTSGGSGARRR